MDNVSDFGELLNMGFPVESIVKTDLLDARRNQTGGGISNKYTLRPVKVFSYDTTDTDDNTNKD